MATTSQKLTVGALLLIVLVSGVIYVSLDDKVRIRVDEDKTTFYIKLLDAQGEPQGRWRVSGREYIKLFQGTKLQYRDAKNIQISQTTVGEKITIKKNTPYKNGASIIQTYEFDGGIEDLELFPISHTIDVYNAEGMILQYEVRDLEYDGETRVAVSPESFGKRMKVEWFGEPYYHKVFQQISSDKIIIKYRPQSDLETYKVRLFDPIPEAATISLVSFGEEWQVYDNTGEFNTYFQDKNDKKTEIGWYAKDGETPGEEDRYLYDCEGNIILKDNGKNLTVKWKNNAFSVDGQSKDGYLIKLKDAESDNINNCVKLNPTEVYQNLTRIVYTKDDLTVNITLRKWNGADFITAPDDVWIIEPSSCDPINESCVPQSGYKFGANDSISKVDTKYQYEWISNKPMKARGLTYILDSELIGSDIREEILKIKDICANVSANCSIGLENLYDPSDFTFQSSILKVNFTATYDPIEDIIVIDPKLDSVLNSATQGFFNNTEGSDHGVGVIYNGTNLTSGGFNSTTGTFRSFGFFQPDSSKAFNITANIATSNGTEPAIYTDANLVAFLPLEDNFTDREGVHDAFCDNCPINASGISSGAMTFDGATTILNFTNDASISLLGNSEITVSIWAYVDPSGAGTTNLFVDKNRGNRGANRGYAIYYLSDGRFIFDGGTTTGNFFATQEAGNINSGRWYHVVGRYDDGVKQIFVNGVDVTFDAAGTSTGTISDPSNLDLLLGGDSVTPSTFVTGSMNNFMLFNRSLSDSEIYDFYKDQLAGTVENTSIPLDTRTSSLYNLESGFSVWGLNNDSSIGETNSFVVDSNGISNGTISGAIFNLTSGVMGGGFSFDGTDDFIGNDTQLASAYPFSMSAWFTSEDGSANDVIFWIGDKDVSTVTYQMVVTGGFVRAWKRNGATIEITPAEGINVAGDNLWHHAVVVFENNTDMKVYVDGVFQTENTTSTVTMSADVDRWTIGANRRSTPEKFFDGLIDEPMFFGRALSSSEISDIYNNFNIDWSAFTSEGVLVDGVPITSTNAGKYMQPNYNYLSGSNKQSGQLINYSVEPTDGPLGPTTGDGVNFQFVGPDLTGVNWWAVDFGLDGSGIPTYDNVTCGEDTPADYESINGSNRVVGSYAMNIGGENGPLGNQEKLQLSIMQYPNRLFAESFRVYFKTNVSIVNQSSYTVDMNFTEIFTRSAVSGVNGSTYRLYHVSNVGGIYNDTGVCLEQPVIIV